MLGQIKIKGESLSTGDGLPKNQRVPLAAKKIWLFRAAAIVVGLFPLVLFEIGLHLFGWASPDGVADPYIGFTEIRPLFELSSSGEKYEISDARKPLFCSDEFLQEKPPRQFRVFCVGGSTVQGRPFATETSFSTWLELMLKAADDSKDWDVVNCGGVSYASYRLAPIVEEIVNYQPDLIVLYTGHNEFLEDRTYEAVKTASPFVVRTHERLSAFKTYSFVRSCFATNQNQQSVSQLPPEVEARLDFRNGLSAYSRDDDWKRDVVRHFEHNLRRMIRATTKENSIPLILCNPVSNLLDASPFKSEFSEPLSDEQRKRFEEALLVDPTPNKSVKSKNVVMRSNLEDRIKLLVELNRLDSRYADLHYQLGQAYYESGDFAKSKQHLLTAKEEDVCPLRIIEPMYDVIERIRSEHTNVGATKSKRGRVDFVDVKAFFESKANGGMIGRDQLIDHVHPTIHGHQLIAELLFKKMVERGDVSVGADFESKRKAIFQQHLESLSHMYFELGKDRLDGLKRWAEGRVTREK